MLELRNITKYFEKRLLLSGINLHIAPGETAALLGPSGSGKSSLLKIIAGLEPADAGSVHWDGRDISQQPPERRRMALMFQDFALFGHLNVQDNVAFGLIEQRVPKAAARARALALLADFGLQGFATRRVFSLSGGEQQRVALARALITAPQVLLLDEPFSALDADLRVALRQEFSQRIAAGGMAALLVTHDEAEARAMAARGWRLAAGGTLQPLW